MKTAFDLLQEIREKVTSGDRPTLEEFETAKNHARGTILLSILNAEMEDLRRICKDIALTIDEVIVRLPKDDATKKWTAEIDGMHSLAFMLWEMTKPDITAKKLLLTPHGLKVIKTLFLRNSRGNRNGLTTKEIRRKTGLRQSRITETALTLAEGGLLTLATEARGPEGKKSYEGVFRLSWRGRRYLKDLLLCATLLKKNLQPAKRKVHPR